jgi:hypothetical protein
LLKTALNVALDGALAQIERFSDHTVRLAGRYERSDFALTSRQPTCPRRAFWHPPSDLPDLERVCKTAGLGVGGAPAPPTLIRLFPGVDQRRPLDNPGPLQLRALLFEY